MKTTEDIIAFSRDALGLSPSVDLGLTALAGRGSDRAYFRLRWDGDESAILVAYDAKRVENAYFADIAVFLHGIGIPTPRIIRHDPAGCLIIMEDLGDTDLWSVRGAPWEERREFYRQSLIVINRLHIFPDRDFPSSCVRLTEPFDAALYRWERDYFKEHFVKDFCRLGLPDLSEEGLEEELSALAARLSAGPKCLVHRDLQSQNLMIRDGNVFLIDFQGMRFGSPFYDLGSLLCDPYVTFADNEREELISFYYDLADRDVDLAGFRSLFWQASAQRLMQALGAYGFLGLRKGLERFLQHVPAGLSNLRRAAAHAGALPRLLELCVICQKAVEQKG